MSSYVKWTKHPETHHWHNAAWIDDYFGSHEYGVRFNDGQVFRASKTKLETRDEAPNDDEDEIIDNTRDQYSEMFAGTPVREEEPVEKARPTEVLLERAKFLRLSADTLRPYIKDEFWDYLNGFQDAIAYLQKVHEND